MPEPSSLWNQLSKDDRKYLNRLLRNNPGSDLPREQFYRATLKAEKSRVATRAGRSTGRSAYDELVENILEYERVTDEEAIAIAMCRLFSSCILWRGVARRIIYEDPAELASALSLNARFHWLDYRVPLRPWADRCYEIWTILHALAAGDFAAARAFFGKTPRMLQDGYTSTVMFYNAVQAIVTGNARAQKKLLFELEAPDAPENHRAALRTLYGIITRDPAIVAAELGMVITRNRLFHFPREEKMVCLIAHALAELAYWVSPDLMSDFDTNRPLPWDREYYKYLHRPNRSRKYLDLSRHSPLLDRWIHGLEEPACWAKCKY